MTIDYWYGHSKKDIAFVSVSFSDLDCVYRGNVYDINRKCIGDFSSNDSIKVEKAFPGVFGR